MTISSVTKINNLDKSDFGIIVDAEDTLFVIVEKTITKLNKKQALKLVDEITKLYG